MLQNRNAVAFSLARTTFGLFEHHDCRPLFDVLEEHFTLISIIRVSTSLVGCKV